jgi:uncharacterized heparinase superfamily protein
MTSVATYLRTIRYLRAAQIVGRARRKWFHHRLVVASRGLPRAMTGRWSAPARIAARLTAEGDARFLGIERKLDQTAWDEPSVSRLWRYNLHYFDDLAAFDSASRAQLHGALIERWIAENPAPRGTGWEPFPTSRRIVNWIKWALDGHALSPDALRSLATQARWLAARLEWHLLGNHLFSNAKALMFAGSFLESEGHDEQWRARSGRILAREIPEQILADGGHFERSPMYHAAVLEDALDLINVMRAFPMQSDSARVRLEGLLSSRIPGMLRWLALLSHPDGSMGLFNDSAEGIAPTLAELIEYAARLGFTMPRRVPEDEVAVLPASGYVRVARNTVVALLDLAPLGPDYIPGHAHADTLSFELSVNGRRVIVNGGTSEYGDGDVRKWERSTAAHSTVEVAGRNSSEVWGAFRVGRRARPSAVAVERHADQVVISGSHDGYRYLRGRPIHHRAWHFSKSQLEIIDRLSQAAISARARFILSPDLTVVELSPRTWSIRHAGRSIADISVLLGVGSIADAWSSMRFGERRGTKCLDVELDQGCARTVIRW